MAAIPYFISGMAKISLSIPSCSSALPSMTSAKSCALAPGLLLQQHGEIHKFTGDLSDKVVGRDEASQQPMGCDNGSPTHAARAHAPDRRIERFVLAEHERIARHDVLGAHAGEAARVVEHCAHDVAIRNDSGGHGFADRRLGNDHDADVLVAHQSGHLQERRLCRCAHRISTTEFSDVHWPTLLLSENLATARRAAQYVSM